MTDEAALLAAVLAAPDDDLPRLVYADWCDENGRPERAEFIRVQVSLAAAECSSLCQAGPCVCERGEWSRRVLRLQHSGRAWWSWYGPGDKIGVLDWRRGFVDSLACTAADWLAHGDAVLAAHPVREVTLTTQPMVLITEDVPGDGSAVLQLADRPGPAVRRAAALTFADADRESLLRLHWPRVKAWHLPPAETTYHFGVDPAAGVTLDGYARGTLQVRRMQATISATTAVPGPGFFDALRFPR